MENTAESDSNTDRMVHTEGSRSRSTSFSNLDAEKVSQGFGTFGAYQILIYAMLNAGSFVYSCDTRIFALIMEKPEFTCNTPKGLNATSDECTYFDVEINSTIKCSSFSYTEGKYAYLSSEFDLVCDNAHYVESSLSLYMLGAMLSTPILTQLADLYGRKIVYLALLWSAVLANIGCALAPNLTVFMVFIFVVGVAVTGIGTVGYVLMLETVAPAFRSYIPLVSTVVWVAGYITVGIVHMHIGSWRWQLFTLFLPFILTLSYYWLLPESIYWLITNNKTTKVKRWIKTAEKFSKKKLNLEECKNSVPLTSDEGDSLFSHCYIIIVMNFIYWSLSIFSTEFYDDKMMGYFLSNLSELPAVGTTFLLIYFGRRTVTSLSLLAPAVVMCIAAFFPGKNVASMTLFLLVRGFNSFSWVAEPLLVTEMAPTSTRNMFYGFITFIGEIGSITAPYFDRLKIIHEAAPAITIAVLSLIAGLLALCSPETMNVPMPQDIDDFNPGPVYSWIFKKPREENIINNIEVSSEES